MESVRVNLGPRSYDIRFGDVAGLSGFAPKAALALIVSDSNVQPFAKIAADSLTAAGMKTATTLVPSGEASKSTPELAKLYDALAALPADRNTLVVAVGGGVIGD